MPRLTLAKRPKSLPNDSAISSITSFGSAESDGFVATGVFASHGSGLLQNSQMVGAHEVAASQMVGVAGGDDVLHTGEARAAAKAAVAASIPI